MSVPLQPIPAAGPKPKHYTSNYEIVVDKGNKLKVKTWVGTVPPEQYCYVAFVNDGREELLHYCREACRERRLTIYDATLVDAKGNSTPSQLRPESAHSSSSSDQVSMLVRNPVVRAETNRCGVMYPSLVVQEALDWMAAPSADTRARHAAAGFTDGFTRLFGAGAEVQSWGDVWLIRDAARLIFEVFPGIPAEEARATLRHSFRRGTKRIGNSLVTDMHRKVQLAVISHIRHEHTNYDALMDAGGDRARIRALIAPKVQAVIEEWREHKPIGNVVAREVLTVLDDIEDRNPDGGDTSSDSVDLRSTSSEESYFSSDEEGEDEEVEDVMMTDAAEDDDEEDEEEDEGGRGQMDDRYHPTLARRDLEWGNLWRY